MSSRWPLVGNVLLAVLLFGVLFFSTSMSIQSARFPSVTIALVAGRFLIVTIATFLIARQVSPQLGVRPIPLMLLAWYLGSRLGLLLGFAYFLEPSVAWQLSGPALSFGLLPVAGESWSFASAATALMWNLLPAVLIVYGVRSGSRVRQRAAQQFNAV